jgi:hypothetical protein
MIAVADLLEPIDRLAAWLPGALGWLPPGAPSYLVAPITVLFVLQVPRWTVRLVLPWLGRYLVMPAAALLTGVITAVGLIVDLAAAGLFRLFWLPLTSGHYAIGDWTIAGARGVRAVSRSGVERAEHRLRRIPRGALLLVGVAVVVLWNAGFCDRNPADGCVAPLTRWWDVTWAWWLSVWD